MQLPWFISPESLSILRNLIDFSLVVFVGSPIDAYATNIEFRCSANLSNTCMRLSSYWILALRVLFLLSFEIMLD